MKGSTKKTFRYFYPFIKKYKWSLSLTIVGITVGSIALNIIEPLLVSMFINHLTEFGQTQNEYFQEKAMFLLVIIAVNAFIFDNLGWRLGGFANAHFQPSVMRDIEQDCLKRFHQHSMHFFSKNFIGSLVSKTNRLVHGFERIADILYWDFLPTILIFKIFLVILFLKSPLLGTVFLLWSIIFIVVAILFSFWKKKYDIKHATLDSKVTGSLADSLTNYSSVKTFSQRGKEQQRFGKTSYERFAIRKFTWSANEYFYVFQGVFMALLFVGTLYIGAQLFFKGEIQIGDLLFIQFVFFDLLRRLWEISRQIKDLSEALADCEEMIEIIDVPYEIKDPKRPIKCNIKNGAIEFKEVDFVYEDQNQVFNSFNLSIKAGEKVGLVGESGSGKTTLTKLLLRFNDIKQGEILIDGHNIARLKQDDLRKNISYVPQDAILFHRTLLENIQYGDLKASKEDVIKAAKKAHAHDFIMQTPEQYKTLVGERGIKLSGGERQRISIARSMLKKAPVLLLDEATSALDSKAEKHIQEALDDVMEGRTTLVIAHRLSTLRKMDRIIVLDQGKIVEEGSHYELLKNKGKYAELWNHQVGGFI